MSATHSPHWFLILVRASVTLYRTSPKLCAMVSALSTKTPFRSARVILPSVASCSSWSVVDPNRLFSKTTASGDCSRSWLIVSLSTRPLANDLLMASIRPAIWSLVLPAVLKSIVAASLNFTASSTLPNSSEFSLISLEMTLAASA